MSVEPVRQNSLYEFLSPPEKVMSQHFVEHFDGDILSERWQTNNFIGTSTFQMADAINQGFEINTDAVNNTQGFIDFNNIRQFDFQKCAMIWEMRTPDSTLRRIQWGLFEDFTLSQNFATITNDSVNTNYEFATRDATTSSIADSGIPIDEVFRKHQIIATSTAYYYSQDGVPLISKTTNLPTTKLQPAGSILTRSAAIRTARYRYVEVFNF